MLIPKGSMIMVPPTAINFDERYDPDPNQYNPDRFLKIADKLATELAHSNCAMMRHCTRSARGIPGQMRRPTPYV